MRVTVIRRTAVAASALSLALLATACSGSDSGDDGKADSTAKETASTEAAAEETDSEESPAGALTADELEELVLADGDVEGHNVEELLDGDVVAAEDISVDKAGCEPLAYALSGSPVGEPAAAAQRRATEAVTGGEELDFDLTLTMVSLFSYDGAGAEEAVAELRTAAADCADGFTLTRPEETQEITGIDEETVSGGEEAFAWTVMADQDGLEGPLKLVVVRQGSTLASFSAFNFGAFLEGGDFDLPTAVVDTQVAKLD